MRVSFGSAPAPPSSARISSRCLIGDKRAGQCRAHRSGPRFAHHATNCQVMGPPLCRALIDSSPLTRFMGVETFLSLTSNWNAATLTGGPGPWLAATGQLSFFASERSAPMNYLQSFWEDEPAVLSNQPPLSKHRCVFNQLLRENYLAWAVKRANIPVCQGWP